MDDDYNNLVGAWPESYVFADKNGVALWKSTFDGKAILELEQANEFLFNKMIAEQGKSYHTG
jgi:hypothetical protein